MTQLAERDYFTDHSILRDPYAYFEALRERGPVFRVPGRDIVVVTGYDEALEVLRDTEHFSSAIAPGGPAVPLPFAPAGDDLTPQIEAHRADFLGGELVVSLDGKPHAQSRALLARLFTPSRLKANEAFIAAYSDELVRAAVARGGCELIAEIATPFVTLVIADLLGVPADDRNYFMEAIDAGPPPGSLDETSIEASHQPLVIMGTYFARYVADRRANPRDDVLTELSTATFPDGTTPELMEIVRIATFLFGAGQDTSAKLLGNALRFIVDQPGLQDALRADPSLIPAMLEEVLRLEGSTKMTARLAKKATRIGEVDLAVGTKVMIALSAANRDPKRWDDPQAFALDRPKIREHLGFGRGAHVCIGAPLARVEVRVLLETLLAHTAAIDFVEAEHGPRGDRTLDYEPSFIIRGLAAMHLKLIPAAGFVAPAADAGSLVTAAAPVATTGYSTATTTIGTLLADPAARQVLDRHFPGVADDPRIGMGAGMTLRTVQAFAPDMFGDAALDAADADLAKLVAA